MKLLFITTCFFWFANISLAQIIKTGEYEFGLKLAYDSKTKKLSGYFENYTGWDETTKSPKFSCVFYIEGLVNNNTFKVMTYHPEYKLEDTISGQIEIVSNSSVKLKLVSEHGGCWNVQTFANESVLFNMEKKAEWTSIKYVIKNKTYFYSGKSEDKKQKAYIVKNDFVCVEKIENEWAYCTFQGEKITKGWVKTIDLNK